MSPQRGLFDEPTPEQIRENKRAELRARHPGMLVLLRVSLESYQWMEEDQAAVEQLGVPVIVPHNDLESVLRKVLRAGCRVAICEEDQ
jgi:hypothetical protein